VHVFVLILMGGRSSPSKIEILLNLCIFRSLLGSSPVLDQAWSSLLFSCSSGKPYSCVMAFSKTEPEPDFLGVSHLDSFDPNAPVIENDFHEFVSNLQSQTSDIILGDTNTKVPGRIKGQTEAYRKADASQYVLDTVTVGYKLIFINNKIPPSSFLPNNKSALSQKTFLYSELLRLEKLGCIRKVSSRPHIVNRCSIVFSNKLRCVLDASQWLNRFCVRRKTVLADLSRIPYLVRQWDYMTVNDLDSGY
jgi:hypothetical protein